MQLRKKLLVWVCELLRLDHTKKNALHFHRSELCISSAAARICNAFFYMTIDVNEVCIINQSYAKLRIYSYLANLKNYPHLRAFPVQVYSECLLLLQQTFSNVPQL